MKFIPTSFRETQRDWFGKKGKSWHLSVAITKAEDGTIEVEIMCLLFCLYRSLTTINKFLVSAVFVALTDCKMIRMPGREKTRKLKFLIVNFNIPLLSTLI